MEGSNVTHAVVLAPASLRTLAPSIRRTGRRGPGTNNNQTSSALHISMRLLHLFLVASLIGLTACTTPPQPRAQSALSPRSGDGLKDVERLIAEEFAKDQRGSIVAGVVRDGELVWTRSLGVADEETGRAARVDSVYPIASVTKMFTGLMLLQLVERGQVHFSDPVERYVPEIRHVTHPYPWSPPITLVQLATMTAGMPRGLSVPEELQPAMRAATTWEDKLAAVVPGFKIEVEPGTISRYSNTGYAVLGLALSRAAKRPFAEYVRSEILQPLGMRDTSFSATPSQEPRLVKGYDLKNPTAPGEPVFNSETSMLLPAAGLLTTVEDLARFMRFQLGKGPQTVLSRKMLQTSYRMIAPSDANLRYADGIGFAVVRDEDKLVAVGHGGSFPEGFTTSYEFDGSTKTGVIFLANTNGGRANYKRLARKILARLNPNSVGGAGVPLADEH